MIHNNSDDGAKIIATTGNPFSKLGTNLTEANVGRGVAGSGGGQVGGDYRPFTIPAAGAYPFRILWENGGTGGGLEVSIYRFLPDGGVANVPLNASGRSEFDQSLSDAHEWRHRGALRELCQPTV
jgi:hypothetical protein